MLPADVCAALVPRCPATAYELAAALTTAGLCVVVCATVPAAIPHATALPATEHLTDAAAWERLGPLPVAHRRLAALGRAARGQAERADRVQGLAAQSLLQRKGERLLAAQARL